MYSPLPAALKPAHVLFLSQSESAVHMDIKSLRRFGVSSFKHLSGASAAIAHLKKEHERLLNIERLSGKRIASNPVDLVVCAEHIDDGPISLFLYSLAQERSLRSQPVLVLTGSPASSRALRAAGIYVLERPYTTEQLERMVQKAMSPMRRLLRADALEKASAEKKLPLRSRSAPKQPVPTPTAPPSASSEPFTVSDWYNRGVDHLKESAFPLAERAFIKVLDKQDDHVDACLGLARVHRAVNNEKREQRFLLRATVSCLRQGDSERATTIAKRLEPRVQNDLFVYDAIACMDEGRFKPAAVSFLDSAREREGTPLHRIVARACLKTTKPNACMEQLCEAFDTLGNDATAQTLRRRLLTNKPLSEKEKTSWLDKFPILKEAVSVASFTASVWKQA